MADCNYLFQKFLSEISVTNTQRTNLQRGRDAVKERIEQYFLNELRVSEPKFCLQGSYALKTMVRPLDQEDYDLDDGVYLQHTDDDISKPTPLTVSSWIVEAVKKHTKKKTINKKNCVRVIYADGYHIDLPVYREVKEKFYLGTLEGNKWILNDAKAFNDWFYRQLEKTEQMRSCIKYLKAWKDFNSSDLKGIHLTVLVGLNHTSFKDRDDLSIVETVQRIIDYIKQNRAIYNPVDESENLIKDWTDTKIDTTINSLEIFHDEAAKALSADNKQDASKIWRGIFGDRFPKDNGNEGKKVVPIINVKHNDNPWGVEW